MSEKEKTILIVIIALIILCGCLMVSFCAGTMLILSRSDRNAIVDFLNESSNSDGSNSVRVQPGSGDSPDQSDTDEKDENGLSEAERLIIAATEKTRNLYADQKMAPVYQTEEELRSFMTEQMDEVTDEELEEELGLYTVLGFTPKDFDLRQFYVDMYTEQIAGFYDPEENKMFLIEGDTPYNNAKTLAHEYTHFLQYNHPEFEPVLNYDDDFCEENGETCVILDALIEGDATLTESLIDVDRIIGKYKSNSDTSSVSGSDVFDNAPKYFQDMLLFPYMYGYDFVAYHYLKGGFDNVNKLFINLPQSVEQIIHPEKYLKDLPVDVTLEPFRSIIADKFDIIQEEVLNESDIKMILASGYEKDWQLDERQASVAADGWGGGAFLYAKEGDEPLLFTKTVWDTEQDAKDAETAFSLYSDRRFGNQIENNVWNDGSSVVHLIRQDDILYWMILPETIDFSQMIDMIKNGSSI